MRGYSRKQVHYRGVPRLFRRALLPFLVGGLLVAGCGSGNAAGRAPMSDSAALLSDAELEADLQVTALNRSEPTYATLAELVRTSSRVAIGKVSAVTSLGFPDAAEDPHASEYFRLNIETTKDLKGSGPMAVSWEGFVTDGKGERTLRIVQNGISMPDVGDELLRFLSPMPPGGQRLLGEDLSIVNTLDGVLYIQPDGTLHTELSGEGRVSHELNGQRVDDVVTAIEGTQ